MITRPIAAAALLALMVPEANASFWDFFKKGSVDTGPGAGKGGVLVTDPSTDTGEKSVAAIMENISNMADTANDLMGAESDSHESYLKEVQKGIGAPSTGYKIEKLEVQRDPLDLVTRRQMFENMAHDDRLSQEKMRPFLLYCEALQTHEARMAVYYQALNNKIEANNARLNWTERMKLQAEVGIIAGRIALADQQMRDIANQAKMRGHLERQKQAIRGVRRRAEDDAAKAMLQVPVP